jgi:hypothetical protein
MQNAKDSFYMALRTRLDNDQSGAHNPAAGYGSAWDSRGGSGSSLQPVSQ